MTAGSCSAPPRGPPDHPPAIRSSGRIIFLLLLETPDHHHRIRFQVPFLVDDQLDYSDDTVQVIRHAYCRYKECSLSKVLVLLILLAYFPAAKELDRSII